MPTKSNRFKILVVQLVALFIVAILAYFVAIFNGNSFKNGDYSENQFKLITFLIIVGAFVLTSGIMYYSYKIGKKKEQLEGQLYIEKELLSLQNKKLRDLNDSIKSIKQSLAIIGSNDRIQWVNSGFEQLFGFTIHEAVGAKASELLVGPLTDKSVIQGIDESIFKKKVHYNAEIVHYRKDRSHFWARLYITPIVDEEGNLVKYIAVSEDITIEKEVLKKLEVSENNFRQITGTINDTVYLYDLVNGKYEFISPNCEKNLGIQQEVFYNGDSAAHYQVHPEDELKFENITKNTLLGIPSQVEYRLNVKGVWKWIEERTFPIFDDKGKVVRSSGVCKDISEEKLIRDQLYLSQHNFRQISETVQETFYLYNIVEKKYEFISENCEEILGLPAKTFYAGENNSHIILHEDDIELYKKATKKVNSGESYTIEYRLLIEDEWKWIEESSFPIVDEQGRVVRNSGTCIDITEKKKILSELRTKNTEVLDSINYAQRIQQATLTNQQELDNIFADYTLFYQPKDIVSGDFYNASVINTNSGDSLKSIVVADCTGHGVPGAVLAITCSNIIQSTFSNPEINSPAEALDFCRKTIINLFNQHEDQIYDGMDVSWCVWNVKSSQLYYAGAFNNCYIVRDEEVIVVPADRMHVAYTEVDKNFTNHVIDVQKGDTVFLTTDGFLDQFGGPDYKKIGRIRFYELIKEIGTNSLSKSNRLEEYFKDWSKDAAQIDDVCVFGFKITE